MIEVVCNDRLGKKVRSSPHSQPRQSALAQSLTHPIHTSSCPLPQVRVKCNEDDLIGDLKKLIAAQIGTRPEKIRLQKWHTVFKDNISLEDYEIHDQSSLEMYCACSPLRRRRGPCCGLPAQGLLSCSLPPSHTHAHTRTHLFPPARLDRQLERPPSRRAPLLAAAAAQNFLPFLYSPLRKKRLPPYTAPLLPPLTRSAPRGPAPAAR